MASEAIFNEEEALQRAMELSVQPDAATVAQEQADYAAAAKELEDANAPEIHMKGNGGVDWEEEMVPVPVNNDMLAQLIDMGVTDVRGRKALVHGGSVDGALAWLTEHQDDADIDQPYLVRLKDTLPKPELTEEEKRIKLEEVKERIKARREERARQEKAEEIKREKERRERGQKLDETMEERQKMQRKRELDKAKREKEAEAKERARLRAEIARDKELRRLNNGVLPSVLGVDGYNPPIIQYNVPAGDAPASSDPAAPAAAVPTKPTATSSVPAAAAPVVRKVASSSATTAPSAISTASPEERIDSALTTIARYRTAGDGGQAIKLLLTFVKNIVEHPDDPKYRSINPESAAFKNKLASLVGPAILLKAVGFEKDESDGKLKYNGAADSSVLLYAQQKLVAADLLYQQQNPV